MKNILLRSTGLFTLLLLFSCGQTGPVDATEEIKKAEEEFIAAFNANDAARLTAVYTADATIYPPNAESISGSEGIQGFWQAVFDAGVHHGMLYTDKATAYGDTAVENGRFELFTADDTPIDNGKYMVIWKKVDGVWKYSMDIWNSSNPLPAPEPEPAEEPSLTDMVDG